SMTDREITLGVRPGDLRIADQGIPARVEFVEDLGDALIVNLSVGTHRVKLKTEPHGPALAEAQPVHLSFAPEAAHLFDRASGQRL
ncbi:MAG: TOBE domain-containing protein, partial [Comamonadaceae bacterium]